MSIALEELGRLAYGGYCAEMQSLVAERGEVLPTFEHLTEAGRKAWIRAASVATAAFAMDFYERCAVQLGNADIRIKKT